MWWQEERERIIYCAAYSSCFSRIQAASSHTQPAATLRSNTRQQRRANYGQSMGKVWQPGGNSFDCSRHNVMAVLQQWLMFQCQKGIFAFPHKHYGRLCWMLSNDILSNWIFRDNPLFNGLIKVAAVSLCIMIEGISSQTRSNLDQMKKKYE